MKQSNKQKVLIRLSDGKWHSTGELIEVYYKFSRELGRLKKDGYDIEMKRDENQSNKF